jgi:hypothetical protein
LISDINLFYVLVWGAVGALAYFTTVSRQWCGVGLTLAFFFNMALLHWFSGMIAILPWYMPAEYYSTTAGFKLSTIGIVAFAVGCFGISPLAFKGADENLPFHVSPSATKIFRIFLSVGIGCILLIVLGLGRIPTLSAVLASGEGFVLVALAFGIWQSYLHQDRRQLAILMASILVFPLLTLILQGFLGFGVGYAIIVTCAFVSIYRPRLLGCLLVIPLAYLALSLYVTYMRDRNEIRGVVWTGGKLESRIDQTEKMFEQFEWFDPWNTRQLDYMNARLNYNWMVGAAVSHLRLTKGFGEGETLWMSVLAMVPRALWPNKPIQAGSMNFVSEYTGITFATGTSVGMGLIFEFYVNFGTYGVIVGMLIMGLLVGYVDRRAGAELRWGTDIAFARWFLIGTFLIVVGASLIEVLPGIVLAMAWTAGLKRSFHEIFDGSNFEDEAIVIVEPPPPQS